MVCSVVNPVYLCAVLKGIFTGSDMGCYANICGPLSRNQWNYRIKTLSKTTQTNLQIAALKTNSLIWGFNDIKFGCYVSHIFMR